MARPNYLRNVSDPSCPRSTIASRVWSAASERVTAGKFRAAAVTAARRADVSARPKSRTRLNSVRLTDATVVCPLQRHLVLPELFRMHVRVNPRVAAHSTWSQLCCNSAASLLRAHDADSLGTFLFATGVRLSRQQIIHPAMPKRGSPVCNPVDHPHSLSSPRCFQQGCTSAGWQDSSSSTALHIFNIADQWGQLCRPRVLISLAAFERPASEPCYPLS